MKTIPIIIHFLKENEAANENDRFERIVMSWASGALLAKGRKIKAAMCLDGHIKRSKLVRFLRLGRRDANGSRLLRSWDWVRL